MFPCDSIKQHFTFPYIANSDLWDFFFMNFHYFEIHISYQLSYMPLYLLFPFLTISSSLMWWGKDEEEEEEEAVLGVIVPEGELTILRHSCSPAPLFPLETSWFCSLSGNPPGLGSFSISVLYSFSISTHFSFCLSQRCAYIVASHSRCVSRFLLCFCLWVWFFFPRMLMHTSFNQPRTTETLHTAPCLFLLCCFRAPSASVTPTLHPPRHPLSFPNFLLSWFLGWTRCPTTHPSRQATPALCASRTLTRAPTLSRCRTGMCSSMLGTSLSWACPLKSRSSTTG